MFTVCALLYGDYPELATRCLHSMIDTGDWGHIREVRIGLNAASARTRAVAFAVAEALPVPCHVYEEANGRNVWKYPLMRRMFHDDARPILGDRIMWFDDDSYITAGHAWWARVEAISRDPALVGSTYYLIRGFRGNQVAGIERQKWFANKPIASRPLFVTGGWWICKTRFIAAWDYPFKELKHNGGDSILSAACHQTGATILHFNEGVAINADGLGRESKAARRGDTTRWPWEVEVPGQPADLGHHDFEVNVTTFPRAKHLEGSA